MGNRFNGLKWNTDVVYWHAVEFGFNVRQCNEYHLQLFHPILGLMNYWPSTGRAQWRDCKTFVIRDIEHYLNNYFRPLKTVPAVYPGNYTNGTIYKKNDRQH